MAANLIDLVQSYLGGPALRQISSVLGESESETQSALAVAVPATIGALVKQASTPAGASALSSLLEKTDTSLLGNLPASLSGGGKGLMEAGTSLGRSLFGSQLDGVSDALSRVTGMGKGVISSLLALITPIVLGVVAKEKRDKGLDASGLAQLLGSQTTFLSGLLPAGVSDALGLSRNAAPEPVRAAAQRDPAPERVSARTAHHAVQDAGSIWKTLLPVAALLLVALIGWSWFSGRTTSEVEASDTRTVTETGALDSARSQLSELIDGATRSLRGVTDVASAEAALPQIESAARGISGIAALDTLGAEADASLSSVASSATATLQPLVDKALALPGVAAVLEPATEALMDALDELRS